MVMRNTLTIRKDMYCFRINPWPYAIKLRLRSGGQVMRSLLVIAIITTTAVAAVKWLLAQVDTVSIEYVDRTKRIKKLL